MSAKTKDFPALLSHDRDFAPLAGDANDDSVANSTLMDVTSDPFSPTPPSVTAPASGVTISSISTAIDSDGHAHVDLGWATVDGAASYEVRYKLTSESLYTYVTTATPSIRISNLLPNTSYDFGVQAVGSGGVTSGYGTDTTQVTAADSSAPADVSGFAVAAGLKSVIATWTANTEADLRDYKVEVATDAGFTSIVQTTYLLATVFAFQGAAATTYYVRVKARDTSGNLSTNFASGNATTAQVVTGDVVPAAITTALIANAAITNALIANSAVDNAQIAALAVTGAKIAANTITAAKIAAGTITATEIAANTITAGQIAAGTITANEIAASTITGAKIAATTITASNIASGTITATQIAAGTITADRMVAATIDAASGILADAVITTAKIAALAVTDAKINDLAVGKLTAGTLSAAVILGGSIKTATSGLRVEQDANGIRLYGYQVPTYRSQGTYVHGTGNVTPGLPTGWAANDIFVLLVESSNEAITAPTGWTEAPNSPQGTGTAATAASVKLAVFYRRAVAGDTAPTVTDTGDHTQAVILAFSGCVTTGSPFDATAGSADSTSNTSASIPGITTTIAHTLALACIATGADITGTSVSTSWFNSGLRNLTELFSNSDNTGTGGSIQVVAGEQAAAGATGSTTATLLNAAKKAYWSGNLVGLVGVTVNLDATTGNGTFSGVITGSDFWSPADAAVNRMHIGGQTPTGLTQTIHGGALTHYSYADTDAHPFAYLDVVYPYAPLVLPEMLLSIYGTDATDLVVQDGTQTATLDMSPGLYQDSSPNLNGPYAMINLKYRNAGNTARSASPKFYIETDGNTKASLSGVNYMPDMPMYGAAQDFKSGTSTRANTVYGPLASADGPSVSVTVGPSGMMLVGIAATLSASANQAWMSFAISGTNTVSAIDQYGINTTSTSFANSLGMRWTLLTGLTPGSGNTVGAQYKNTTSGTVTAANRLLIAIPL